MRLMHIIAGAPAVLLATIGADAELAWDVQTQLAQAGLLDPPADRLFGPVSQWALSEFLTHWGLAGSTAIDAQVASALLQSDAAFPLVTGPDLAGDVARAMHAAGHWICRHPKALNIVYVEGMGLDGEPNGKHPNRFNDARLLLRAGEGGRPEIAGAWEGTTEPGRYYEEIAPLDARGAARIAFGQFKAWSVGVHHGGTPHEALVQTQAITVHRDLDRDYRRDRDQTFSGLFGINQHCGYDLARGDIGRASAGCLVGRTRSGHREFMAMLRGDPRYRASKGYRFMTSVLPADAVLAARG